MSCNMNRIVKWDKILIDKKERILMWWTLLWSSNVQVSIPQKFYVL